MTNGPVRDATGRSTTANDRCGIAHASEPDASRRIGLARARSREAKNRVDSVNPHVAGANALVSDEMGLVGVAGPCVNVAKDSVGAARTRSRAARDRVRFAEAKVAAALARCSAAGARGSREEVGGNAAVESVRRFVAIRFLEEPAETREREMGGRTVPAVGLTERRVGRAEGMALDSRRADGRKRHLIPWKARRSPGMERRPTREWLPVQRPTQWATRRWALPRTHNRCARLQRDAGRRRRNRSCRRSREGVPLVLVPAMDPNRRTHP